MKKIPCKTYKGSTSYRRNVINQQRTQNYIDINRGLSNHDLNCWYCSPSTVSENSWWYLVKYILKLFRLLKKVEEDNILLYKMTSTTCSPSSSGLGGVVCNNKNNDCLWYLSAIETTLLCVFKVWESVDRNPLVYDRLQYDCNFYLEIWGIS